MPTYEYECEACGHAFERFQNMSDKPVRTCPECGGKVRRLIGKGAAVIFKGGGSASSRGGANRPTCGRDTPCCGLDTPCDNRPCDE